ncbi:MAG: ATP-binding cassette domain-containing protein [Clostridium sp.]|nr:ATP-binding cassette domain-containing protein [Clostridium sp.]
MNRIELKKMLPVVFAARTDVAGDIWRQEVVFERGGLYLIEAASGTGKSSLCSYIVGYRNDYEGQLLFDGKDARSLDVEGWVELRRRSLSLLFQELRLFPELTALENVEVKNKLTGRKTRAEILRWFDELGIPDKVDVKLGRMSFGQQQRVALMRALVQPFDFLLADEPVSHLDDANGRVMARILMEEACAQGAGVIVTSIGKHMDLNYDKIYTL